MSMSRRELLVARPARPAADECQIVSPAVREYLVQIETYATFLEARAWTVATELRYEAENRGDATFSDLADELAAHVQEAHDAR